MLQFVSPSRQHESSSALNLRLRKTGSTIGGEQFLQRMITRHPERRQPTQGRHRAVQLVLSKKAILNDVKESYSSGIPQIDR
jgi:hypothetical protein